MKILHIEMGKHLYGGAQQVAYLVQGLNQMDIDNYLLAPRNSAIAEKLQDTGCQVVRLDYAGDLDARLTSKVRNLVTREKIDLVHIHSRRGADFWGALGAKWAGVPVILSRRVDNPESSASIRFKYPLFDQVICISEGIRKVLIENGLTPEKSVCVRSAFIASDSQSPIPRSDFLKLFDLPADSLVIGTVAQLIPRKGHKLLIEHLPELLQRHTEIQLLFFGEGSERDNLEQEIHSRNLSHRIKLVGFHDNLNSLIANLDILAHPAYAEGLGVSLIQASAASVPIVASAVGGIPEIVRNGENGFLVDPGDGPALISAIEQLVGNAELRSEFGSKGRQIAEQEFSVENMVAGNLDQYRKVLGI